MRLISLTRKPSVTRYIKNINLLKSKAYVDGNIHHVEKVSVKFLGRDEVLNRITKRTGVRRNDVE